MEPRRQGARHAGRIAGRNAGALAHVFAQELERTRASPVLSALQELESFRGIWGASDAMSRLARYRSTRVHGKTPRGMQMTEINAVAGRRAAIIRRAFSSVPMDYRFSARVAIPGQVLGGSVEIRKSRWIIPGSPAKFSLHENNVVSAGFWNTFMSADVVPDVDVVITTERRGSRKLLPILLIALLVIVVAAVMAVAFRG